MAKAKEGVFDKVLECAKREFMEKGYQDASLRVIARNAGTSTGSIYRRFTDKAELFDAVVRNTLDDLDNILQRQADFDVGDIRDEQLMDMCDLSKQEDATLQWLRFLYDRRDDMFLLLARADNTRYADFQHDWVERVMQANHLFFAELERRGLTEFHTSERELHILQSAYWQALYEPFVHRASWEEIESHCRYISRFFNWPTALGFKSDH
jgi:AcrR family transcriptional regulator